MKMSKTSKTICFTFICLTLLQERLMYITDKSFVMIISILGMLIFLVKYKIVLKKNTYNFKKSIITLILVELYGIVVALCKYGQSPVTGLIGTHYIFIYGFYFWFAQLLRNGDSEHNICILKNVFIKLGTAIALLIIMQAFVYPVVFLKMSYAFRNGLRILGCHIIQYSFVVAICDIIANYSKKKIIPIIVMLYYLIVVNQSRNVVLIMSIIIAFLLLYKTYKKSKFKFFFSILALPFIALIGWNMGIGKIVIELFAESQSIQGNTGMRLKELNYYYNLLKESKYLGIGILGDGFQARKYIYGTDQGFYFEDIGISAFIFKTGIFGLFWTIAYEKTLIKSVKKTSSWERYLLIFVALKTVLSMFFSVSFLFDIRDGLIYYVIILSIIDTNIYNNSVATMQRA